MTRDVKVLCPECERLVTLERFRTEGSALIVICARCGAETRVERELAAPAPVAAPAMATQSAPVTAFASSPTPLPTRTPSQPPRGSLASSSGGSNVVLFRTPTEDAVQKAARAADEGPFVVPPEYCPKCISPRSAAPNCPRCGVRYEAAEDLKSTLPQWLRTEWVDLLRVWSNEARHAELRLRAQSTDALALVGRLYRLRQAVSPEDPITITGLSEVVRMASGSFVKDPGGEDAQERRKTMIFGVMAVLALGALSIMLVLIINSI